METRTDTHFDFGFWILDFGFEAAKCVFREFKTKDVYEIAQKVDVKIEFGRWAAVTAGEFERKAKTIRVNMKAVEELSIPVERIVAHELGHYFFREYFINRHEGAETFGEEKFADDFAECLLKL